MIAVALMPTPPTPPVNPIVKHFLTQFRSLIRAGRIGNVSGPIDMMDCSIALGLLYNARLFLTREEERLKKGPWGCLSPELQETVVILLEVMLDDIEDLMGLFSVYIRHPERRGHTQVAIRDTFKFILYVAKMCMFIYIDDLPNGRELMLQSLK